MEEIIKHLDYFYNVFIVLKIAVINSQGVRSLFFATNCNV